MKNKQSRSALKVNEGISKPPAINRLVADRYRNLKRLNFTVEDFIQGIQQGDRAILSKAITLVESSLLANQEISQQIICRCLPY